ncbi:holo-ACP synthase [Bacillus sp. SM2101]|uniref:holo-ACP synthase n=1 Tax=Bacillus sp. SM2101 TaxID=2805366 RepID=UPI001BDEB0A0|nr:holo-ACP synthase [Bacillus sp. SM2101]
MIYGTGIDIQNIGKFKKLLDRSESKFVTRVFTDREISYSKKKDYNQSLAGRWTAKEAFFKALGTGIRSIQSLKEVEVINLPNGKPHIFLYGELKSKFEELNLKIDVSISHSVDYAISQVIISQKPLK